MPVKYLGARESSNKAMQDLMSMVSACARSDVSVLIQGETGSGKEVICRELHRQSSRANKPLIAINCAAIPAALLESELFGHRKGAFTGAMADRVGRLEKAHLGTLFLDEVGDMPLDLQVKLLRVLEERVVEPVGGDPRSIDVRVVAATHCNLRDMVANGTFREDLYYRLNVVELKVPPLRERQEDIPAFCQHFADAYAIEGPALSLNAASLQILRQHNWPGNVRELSNLIMRLNALFPGQRIDLRKIPSCTLPECLQALVQDYIQAEPERKDEVVMAPERQLNCLESAPALIADPQGDNGSRVADVIRLANGLSSLPLEGIATRRILQALERKFIKVALGQSNGNVSKAASLLQLQRTTVIQKISKYRLADDNLGLSFAGHTEDLFSSLD